MSRNQVSRVTKLENRSGVGSKLYVYAVRFDVLMCDDSMKTPEFRYLMRKDGSEKGQFIRQLKPMEILKGIPGGEAPWIVNPAFTPRGEDEGVEA